MSANCQCQICGRDLTGAIEFTSTKDDKFVYLISRETPDCNWSRCRGCKTILCKKCDSERPYYCCEEGRIVSRERAQQALSKHKTGFPERSDSSDLLLASGK